MNGLIVLPAVAPSSTLYICRLVTLQVQILPRTSSGGSSTPPGRILQRTRHFPPSPSLSWGLCIPVKQCAPLLAKGEGIWLFFLLFFSCFLNLCFDFRDFSCACELQHPPLLLHSCCSTSPDRSEGLEITFTWPALTQLSLSDAHTDSSTQMHARAGMTRQRHSPLHGPGTQTVCSWWLSWLPPPSPP